MPYVRRDVMGRIESVHRTSSTSAVEYLDATDTELAAFLSDASGARERPDSTGERLRVQEEVLGLLIAKRVISVDELSPEAQATWLRFQEARGRAEAANFSASGFVEIIDDSAFGQFQDKDDRDSPR